MVWKAIKNALQNHSEALTARDNYGFDTSIFIDAESPHKNRKLSKRYWCRVGSASLLPPPREGHTSVVFNESMFVFGGQSTTGIEDKYYSELWEFNFFTHQWKLIKSKGTIPTPRTGHSAVIVESKYMFLFGGKNSDTLGDTYKLDLETFEWIQQTSDVSPIKTAYHSCVVYEKSFYVFGGTSGLNQVFEFDTSKSIWRTPKCSGQIPSARYGHSGTIYNQLMLIYGGFHQEVALNDLYALNLITLQWQRIDIGGQPPRRFYHSSVMSGDSMFLFGGQENAETLCNDVFEVNCKTWQFSGVYTNGGGPNKRSQHSAVAHGESMYVFGGTSGCNDVFEFNFKLLPNMSDLHRVWRRHLFGDTVVHVEDENFIAHRSVISQSKMLYKLVKSATEKRADDRQFIIEITLLGIEAEVFRRILGFMYLGKVDIGSWTMYIKLMQTARMIDLDSLVSYCLGKAYDFLRANNVLKVLEKAHELKLKKLKYICLHFIYLHQEEVLKQKIQQLPQELLKELLNISSFENTTPIVFKKTNGERVLYDHIVKLYQSKEFSDVLLITRDKKRLRAHRALLCAFSNYFASYFANLSREDQITNNGRQSKKKPVRAYKVDTSYVAVFDVDAYQQQIFMNEIDGEKLELILEYIYTRDVTLPNDYRILLDIIRYSDIFLMKGLKELATIRLFSLINPQNSFSIIEFCNEHNIEGVLKEQCWKVINNASKEDLIQVILKIQLKHSSEISALQRLTALQQEQLEKQSQLNKSYQQQLQQLQRAVKKVEMKYK